MLPAAGCGPHTAASLVPRGQLPHQRFVAPLGLRFCIIPWMLFTWVSATMWEKCSSDEMCVQNVAQGTLCQQHCPLRGVGDAQSLAGPWGPAVTEVVLTKVLSTPLYAPLSLSSPAHLLQLGALAPALREGPSAAGSSVTCQPGRALPGRHLPAQHLPTLSVVARELACASGSGLLRLQAGAGKRGGGQRLCVSSEPSIWPRLTRPGSNHSADSAPVCFPS